MAIYSMHVSMVQRSKGENAIAAGSYISRTKLTLNLYDEHTGLTTDFTWDYAKNHEETIAYSAIHAPEGVVKDEADWVFDREALWNKCEFFEKRENAQPARKMMLALPCELSREQNIELTKQFVEEYLVSRGMIVDVNIHYDNENNPHAHLLMTTRELIKNRFGEVDFAPTKQREWQKRTALMYEREGLANVINEHLEKHGFLDRISHLSHKDRGIELEPGKHEGPARHMKAAELKELNQSILADNVERILKKPELILEKLSINKPVFTKEDIVTAIDEVLMHKLKFTVADGNHAMQKEKLAKLMQQTITDSDTNKDGKTNNDFVSKYNILYQQVMNSDALSLVNESDLKGRCLYAKTSRIKLEERYIDNITTLNTRKNHSLDIAKNTLLEQLDRLGSSLNSEKQEAILNILNGSDISILEGVPGSGKTTAVKVIADIYKAKNYKIIATAPSSSAALSLSAATGIECSNLSLLRKKWIEKIGGDKFKLILRDNYFTEEVYAKAATELTNKHVLVIDEASMVELSNMDYFISHARASGAKVILVGDNNQFAAVGYAGALNKATNICGSEKLEESRRQNNPLHREATSLLSNYRIQEALDIYKKDGSIIFDETREQTITHLVADYVNNYLESAKSNGDNLVSDKNMVICTYTNQASRVLNNQVREKLKNAGVIRGKETRIYVGNRNISLAKGDQIVFTRNFNYIKDTQYKKLSSLFTASKSIYNGEVGTILSIKSSDKEGGYYITVSARKADNSYEKVTINTADYQKGNLLDYGYAVTAYKLQGATIDIIYALYEKMVGYEAFLVMMTRHRNAAYLYADKESLIDMVYSRLGLDIKSAQDRYQITNEDLLHEIGLNISLRKRVNNNFAVDYGDDSKDANLVINANIIKYIENNKKASEIIRIISQDINIGRLKQSEIAQHKFWSDFTKYRNLRDSAAKDIVANYADYQDKLLQLSMNYATIEKHAGAGDHYLVMTRKTLFSSNPYYRKIFDHIEDNNIKGAYAAYKVLKREALELHAKLEASKEELDYAKSAQHELNTAINDEIEYREKLLPEYLKRIYKDSPDKVLARWKNYVSKQKGSDPAVNTTIAARLVTQDPGLLGKMHGVGFKVPIVNLHLSFSSARDNVMHLWDNNLSSRLIAYDKSQELERGFKMELENNNYGEKIKYLENEIENLRSMLPDKFDQEFMNQVGDKLKHGAIGYQFTLNAKMVLDPDLHLNSLKESSIYFDARLKALQTLQEQEDKKYYTASAANVNNRVNERSFYRKDKDQPQTQYNTNTKNPKLTFSEVKAKLSSSVNQSIFRDYALMINRDGKIEKQGHNMKCGSLIMDLNKGLWYRFSTQQKGDIFSFVAEATGASKYESLQLIAEKVGINTNDYDFNKSYIQNKGKNLDTKSAYDIKPASCQKALINEWIAVSNITNKERQLDTPSFKPEHDLSFLKQKGHIENYYAYRNKDNKLLGYTIRFIDTETGDKQVMPVTYCHNEYLGKSAWRLKIFTDNGYKPIYGREKIEQNLKPILIVEGEKTADIASKTLGDEYTVISWLGGAKAADKVNWQELKERDVVIWPDNDKPGVTAAHEIKNAINKANGFDGLCHVVDTSAMNLPEKWDLGDVWPKDLTKGQVQDILNLNLKTKGAKEQYFKQVHASIYSIADKNEHANSKIEKNTKNIIKILSSSEINHFTQYETAKGSYDSTHEFLSIRSSFYQELLATCAGTEKIENLDTSTPQEILDKLEGNFQNTLNDYHRGKFGAIITDTSRTNQQNLEKSSYEQTKLHEVLLRDAVILHSIEKGSILHDWHVDKLSDVIKDTINQHEGKDYHITADKVLMIIQGKEFKHELNIINDQHKQQFQDRKDHDLKQITAESVAHFAKVKTINPAFDQKAQKTFIDNIMLSSPHNRSKMLKTEIGKAITPAIEKEMHAIDKQKDACKTAYDYLKVMKKEIEYSHFIGMQYAHVINNYDLMLTVSTNITRSQNEPDALKNIGNIVHHLVSNNILPHDEIIKNIKQSYHYSVMENYLTKRCHNHYSTIIDKHLENIKHGHEVRIGDHKFRDPIKFLEHQHGLCDKHHAEHKFMPKDHIEKTLNNYKKQQIELQKQQELAKQKIVEKDIGMSL